MEIKMFKKKTLEKLVGPAVVVGFIGISVLGGYTINKAVKSKGESKILPYQHGGLPLPFATELVDDNRDGTPDRALLHSIGPMFYNGQERTPKQSEIDWYKSQE